MRKRLRGQALMEFLCTLPLVISMFLYGIAMAEIWNQQTFAERLSLEGASLDSVSPGSAQSVVDYRWNSIWGHVPITTVSSSGGFGRLYEIDASYQILWTMEPYTPITVNIRGKSASLNWKFIP
jgi:hypothetical protein